MQNRDTAILGSGCFGLAEAIFKRLKGVAQVEEGYTGGHTTHPTYEEVCRGESGHIEIIRICYYPAQISYRQLLRLFFAMHDPTSLDRQGDLVGMQYRSVIFYLNNQQEKEAFAVMAELARHYSRPLVTQVRPMMTFWPAEAHWHQNFDRNPEQRYCQYVIAPKLAQFQQEYPDYFK